MLLLTRKIGQSIVFGDMVTVTVLKAVRGKVTLGIDAPANVPIRRGELDARKQVPTASLLIPLPPQR